MYDIKGALRSAATRELRSLRYAQLRTASETFIDTSFPKTCAAERSEGGEAPQLQLSIAKAQSAPFR